MKKIVFILVLGLLLASCGKKESVKQVSMESKRAIEAFALADTVKEAFLKNDLDTIKNKSSEEGYRDITAYENVYDRVEMTFTPRWVEIDKDRVTLNVAWKSRWTISGRTTEDRGMAVFVMEGSPLSVSKIARGNPFVFQEK